MRLPFTKLAGVVVGCAVAALLVPGCSAPPPRQSPRALESVAASATSRGLTLSVEIPASELSAGTTQTGTTTLVNSTETTIDVAAPIRVTVSDSAGKTVYNSFPGGAHFIWELQPQPLAPHATLRRKISFKVPPPGACTITASQQIRSQPDLRLAVHFTSVR